MAVMRLYWDIETSPLPPEDILALAPEFQAPANYKKPEAIAASIEEQRRAWMDRAALSPITATVAAIGMLGPGVKSHMDFIGDGGERALLDRFWIEISSKWSRSEFIGFCIKRFDLPFLCRRSWKHGIRPPKCIRDGRYWARDFVDLAEVWQLGNNQDTVSLATLAKYFGLKPKTGNGKDFHKLPLEEKRDYLFHDLELTQQIAELIL